MVCDLARDASLEAEHLCRILVVPLCEHVLLVNGPDDLHVDADPIVAPPDPALDDVVDVQLAADMGHVRLPALVAHGRGASDHREFAWRHRRQLGDDIVGHRVAGELLRGIAARVDERQHEQPHPLRRRRCCHGQLGGRRNEPVAALGQRFDEAGMVGRIVEGVAQPGDRAVQDVVEIDEHAVGPEPAPQVVAADQLPRVLEEGGQDLEGLIPERHLRSALVELPRCQIDFEAIEAQPCGHGLSCDRWLQGQGYSCRMPGVNGEPLFSQ